MYDDLRIIILPHLLSFQNRRVVGILSNAGVVHDCWCQFPSQLEYLGMQILVKNSMGLSFKKAGFSPQNQTMYRSFYIYISIAEIHEARLFFSPESCKESLLYRLSPEALLVWSIWWRTIQRCLKIWKMKFSNCWTTQRCRVPQAGTAAN